MRAVHAVPRRMRLDRKAVNRPRSRTRQDGRSQGAYRCRGQHGGQHDLRARGQSLDAGEEFRAEVSRRIRSAYQARAMPVQIHLRTTGCVKSPMPKLTIDGKEVDAGAHLNLIQAAEIADIEIPHYCFHPGLSIPGNCRMCLVEVEKAPKLQIACNTRVADGMVVHTTSDKAKTAQKAVLEFLLINHPIDCPVCDQAGECKLQEYYMDYDRQRSRMPLGEKNHKGKAIDIGSDVMLDQERCILCARCTRFFDEITKTSELAIFERADHNRIDINPGQPVNNKYAGNVIDICPVGALTEKDFRFRMRVWYLHKTSSVCGGCERGCSIDIHHQRGRIYRFKPRFNPDVNSYWMCDEGRHSFLELQHETRLTAPLVQAKDELVAETWGAAVLRAGAAIEDFRRLYGA